MTRLFRITIDLERLRQNFCHEDRRQTRPEQVVSWLEEAGFVRASEGWLVREEDLGQIRPEEVTRAEVVNEGAMVAEERMAMAATLWAGTSDGDGCGSAMVN